MKHKVRVGDAVRVVQSTGKLGPTLWIVTKVGQHHSIALREAGTKNAEQLFDVDLVRKVDPADQRVADIKESTVPVPGPALLAQRLPFGGR